MIRDTSQTPISSPNSIARIFDGMSIALMVAILFLMPVAIALIWVTTLASPLILIQQLVPSASGTTLQYRVTLPDGTTHYQSTNVGQLRGNDAFNLIELNARTELMARYLGLPFSEISEAEMSSFLASDVARVRVARVIETTYTPTTTLTTNENLFLLQSERIELISINNQAFSPFVPFFDNSLNVGESLSSEGNFALYSPYEAILTFETIEAVDTPLRRFEGCRRFLLAVDIPDVSTSEYRSWFCQGVGLVAQEQVYGQTDAVTRLDIIAAETPVFSESGDLPPLLPPPAVTPLPQPVSVEPAQWETIWSFRSEGVQADISTEVVPFGNLYIYGDEGGNLIAIHQDTHTMAWRFQTSNSLFSKPIVANGMIYSTGSNRTLYALDPQNGTFRWAFRAEDLLSASPAIADGVLYLGAEDGTFYALDAQTGEVQWQYETAGPIAAPPVVHQGVVYIGSDDGGLYALDIATHEPRWIFPSDAGIVAGVAIEGDRLFVGNVAGDMYALALNSTLPQGEILWKFEVEDAVEHTPLILDGQVYLALLNYVQVLDGARGDELWRYHTEQSIRGNPLVMGEQLLINTPRTIIVLNRSSGTVIGTIPTGSPDSFTPVSTDGINLLVGHGDGFLRVMNSTPTHVWQAQEEWTSATMANQLFNLSDELSSPPVATDEGLLYVSAYGQVFRLNRTTGTATALGETNLELAYLPPVVTGDILLTGNFFGELVAFDLNQNRVRWRGDVEAATFTSAFVENDRVLWAATADAELTAYGFDLATGEIAWQQSFPYQLDAAPSALLHQGVFYVVGDSLNALDPATGEVLWQSAEPFRPLFLTASGDTVYTMSVTEDFSTLVVGWDINRRRVSMIVPYDAEHLPSLYGGMVSAEGKVLLASLEGDITLVDTTSRQVVWQTTIEDGVLGSPVMLKDEILYITRSNHLHARSMEDGALLGDFTLQSVNSYTSQSTMRPLIVDNTLYAGFYQTAFALPLRK